MIPRALGVALALPIAFAALVLATTAANGRAGRGPTVLSEREAVVSPRTSDRSVAEVWLQWTEPAGMPGAWITRDSLDALGFGTDMDPADARAAEYYRRQLSRRAFIAFELNGPAWDAAVAQRTAATPAPARGSVVPEQVGGDVGMFGSRLVPVAIDRDGAALAQRFPDPRTHLITAGTIRIVRFERVGDMPYVGGMVANIDPRRIQVAAEHAAALPLRGPLERPQERRYVVSLVYGSRWEPWVARVEPGASP